MDSLIPESDPLDALSVGMSADFAKTVTDADITLYAGISGDTNPLHLDADYAGRSMFQGRIAHGMLSVGLISAVLGTKLPGPGAVYMGQTLRFLAPVRIGDTVKAIATITEIDPEKRRITLSTVCRVRDKDVLTGEARMMLPKSGA